jgi:NAD-dependent dihydropyrimidine dehydrogenase PreA subunit
MAKRPSGSAIVNAKLLGFQRRTSNLRVYAFVFRYRGLLHSVSCVCFASNSSFFLTAVPRRPLAANIRCIVCGTCMPVCPVSAIFALDGLPEKWNEFTAKNAAYYGR